MLLGTYSHQVDDKNRIRIPSKFKAELGEKYVFSKGVDGVVNVYTEESMQQTLKKYENINELDTQAQYAYITFMSGIFTANEDKQGRVTLDDEILSHLSITNDSRDIVTIGMNNKLSILNKKVWEEQKAKTSYSQNLVILNEKKNGWYSI